MLAGAGTMTISLCETCKNMREIRMTRSQFLLCEQSSSDPAYLKYPPQPVVRCNGYESQDTDSRQSKDHCKCP